MRLLFFIWCVVPSLIGATVRVYVTNGNAEVAVLNADNNTFIGTFSPMTDSRSSINLQGVAISPDQTTAYIADQGDFDVGNEGIWIINTNDNSTRAFVPLVGASFPTQIAVLPSGSKVYVSDKNAEAIFVMNTADNSVSSIPDGVGKPMGLAFNPSGTRLYVSDVASGANEIYVYDTSTDAFVTAIEGTRANFIAVSSQGIGYEPNSNGDGTDVAVFDTSDNTALDPITTSGVLLDGVAFTRDGNTAYVASNDPAHKFLQVIQNGVSTSTIALSLQPWQVVINPTNDNQIYCTANGSSKVMVVSNGVELQPNPFGDLLTSATYLAYIATFSPTSLRGQEIYNRFVLQTDIVHRLTWEASNTPNVVAYSIMRNGVQIATVRGLSYDDHNRSPNERDYYEVRAISINGDQSNPVSIYIP